MKTFIAAVCTSFVFLLPSAHAQVQIPAQVQTAAPIDPATAAAVNELLVTMKQREVMAKSFEQLHQNIPAILLQGATAGIYGNPKLSDAEKKAAIAEVPKQIPAIAKAFGDTLRDPKMMDELFAEVAPLYARHFTVAEIKELNAFYKTPLGKKMIELTPQIAQESTLISQRILMPRIQTVIRKLMQSK